MKTAYIGSDIASRWFDVCVLIEDRRLHQRFNNDLNGCETCFEWISSLQCADHVVAFEPTGRYSELFGEFFAQKARMKLIQVNVRKFREYANSLEVNMKTDSADAFALSVYAKERSSMCRQFKVMSSSRRELRDVQMRLRSLVKRSTALKSQDKCGLYSHFIVESVQTELSNVEKEYERVLEQARQLIIQDLVLGRDKKLLESIPGIGDKTAVLLLCLVDFRQFRSSRSLARFLGLTQGKRESGSSIRGRERITKAGSTYVRSALFFPAMTAMKHNPDIRTFSERLLAQGKHFALVRTAVVRKLATLAWSVIRHDRPFEAFINN